MKTYRIGTALTVAMALIVIPAQKSSAARKRQPAQQQQQSQTNARPNPNDPGGHSAKGFEFAKKKEYDKAVAEFTEAIKAEPKELKGGLGGGGPLFSLGGESGQGPGES